MVGVIPNKSLFTININGLHTAVKIRRFHTGGEKSSYILKKISKHKYRKNENKRIKKISQTNNQTKAAFLILIREKGGALRQKS